MKNQRRFSNFSRSTECYFAIVGISIFGEFLSSWSTESCILVIDGILYRRDRRNSYFRDRRIKWSNQAIDESSDRRIKRSIVSITLKIRDREFSRNWNSGIPGKKRRKRKKFPFQQAQNGAPRTCSRPCFLILLGASLKKNVNTKPQEGQKKIPILHCTLVLVGKGTLLELARVSMLPCCAHAEKKTRSIHLWCENGMSGT